ncbi:hypothetical protein BC826DRAFT_738871 [Russula brevipes]|nr:hypothetical protein BC826DRAFT_738871 [Russula brevipes]
MIYVLVDKQAPGHVFLEDGEGKPTRAFGNVWRPDDVMTFNGVRATSANKELVRKEIHGLPELSWCSECQDPGTRVQVPGVLDWKLFIRETSKMPSASVRIRAGHADRRVAVEAQVVCSNTNQDTPQTPTDQESLPPPKRFAPDSGLTAAAATTTTTTPLLSVPVAPGPAETRAHRSSSTALPSIISRPHIESTDPRGTPPPTTVQDPGQNLPRYPRDFQQHPPVLSSPQPPSFLNRTDPPPNQVGVAPMTDPRCESGTSQHPHTQPTNTPNPLPRSEENKVPPTGSQAKITRSTLSNLSPKPSATIAPCPLKIAQSPMRLTMPGAFPGTSLDVDVSSWVLVSPGGPVEAPKTGWFKRIISRFA